MTSHTRISSILVSLFSFVLSASGQVGDASGQDTRLLRQPSISASHIVFTYGADVWVVDRNGGDSRRITSTPAVESNPHFSPDGSKIAFTSDRSGVNSVYIVSSVGGSPTRLTWYPANSIVRGWTNDGLRVLYASDRETAPSSYNRLWTVSVNGGPSEMLPAPWGNDASFSADGKKLVIDQMTRWDSEWRNYRGGQNTPLRILDLESLEETMLPNDRTTDVRPVWMDGIVFFLSDRNRVMNVWSFDVATEELSQVTYFENADVKWLSGGDEILVLEQDGWIHTLYPASAQTSRLSITVNGDFPWSETRWEDVSDGAASASLSSTGKRALFESRGEIFTVPVEDGDSRNMTRSSAAADRAPVWSPDGSKIAWFSDKSGAYQLMIAEQDGMTDPRSISIGVSKMAWDPTWSPDGKWISFIDDDLRVRVVDVVEGEIRTADTGGSNIERSSMEPVWSPDSKWLAYSKTFPNNFHRIVVWSLDSGDARSVTDAMADAVRPAWDRDGRHLYFLASTNLALGSGWANTSSIKADAAYAPYVMVLRADDSTPFPLKSDEEEVVEDTPAEDSASDDREDEGADEEEVADEDSDVRIDFDGIERRIISLQMPTRNYALMRSGPEGSLFIGERAPGQLSLTLHKFTLEDGKAEEFLNGISQASVSNNGKKLLVRAGSNWRVVDTASKPSGNGDQLTLNLRMNLDRRAEWRQIYEEAWRYERDYFYDPNMHGNDWDKVYERYEPLIEHVRHRSDLTYVLDQVNGELSVGHSFVRGGDLPSVDSSPVGLLGADFVARNSRWQIERILTSESWNPDLSAPLDEPGLKVEEGHYVIAVNGSDLTTDADPYQLLDGTAGRQTVLQINDRPSPDGAWTVTVKTIRDESGLRQRAWVEDNRRRVDELSGGKLAYAWIPNTAGAGVVSFDRYYFSQQDKLGAVIDERYNGGGNLDDYMVDLMTRELRAAITNEVPNGEPFRLPAGILGPKVLLINERAGSGGDFFPWVFRQQNAGLLIGKSTWGGLVKSSVHYRLVDGGTITAPDNGVFDPINNAWIAENEGVAPDIDVYMDAISVSQGRDPQLERGVTELLRILREQGALQIVPPSFSKPGGWN